MRKNTKTRATRGAAPAESRRIYDRVVALNGLTGAWAEPADRFAFVFVTARFASALERWKMGRRSRAMSCPHSDFGTRPSKKKSLDDRYLRGTNELF